jgi:hypothetical protein
VQRGGGDGHESAHAVADDDRAAAHLAGGGDGDDLLGPLLERVRRAVAAVTVAGQVEGHDAEFVAEGGGDVRPPMGVRTAAVHEDQPAGPGWAEGQRVDGTATDVDLEVAGGHGQGPPEPRRCRGRG